MKRTGTPCFDIMFVFSHTVRTAVIVLASALVLLLTGADAHAQNAASDSAGDSGAETVVSPESGAEYNAGLELYRQRRFADSLARFEKAFKLDERNTAALFAQGLAFNSLKKYPEAASVIERLLKIEPNHDKALRLYPVVLEQAGRNDDALAAYDKALAVIPDNADLNWGRGRVFVRMQKHKEAIPPLEAALRLDPANQRIRLLLAQTFVNVGRPEEAFKAADTILAAEPNNARARVIVADWKRQKGDYEAAIADYTAAAKNIETKAYSEHFIEVIRQQMEEEEIENEYRERLNQEQPAGGHRRREQHRGQDPN